MLFLPPIVVLKDRSDGGYIGLNQSLAVFPARPPGRPVLSGVVGLWWGPAAGRFFPGAWDTFPSVPPAGCCWFRFSALYLETALKLKLQATLQKELTRFQVQFQVTFVNTAVLQCLLRTFLFVFRSMSFSISTSSRFCKHGALLVLKNGM